MVDEINVSAQMKIQVSASDDDNSFTIAAAKVGSKSFSADGTKYIFTAEALKACAESWIGGKITLNHDVEDEGVITASWLDESTGLVMQTITCDNPETAARVKAGEPTGVSIEATILEVDDDNNVLAFNGTGVGIMFYPVQPACPLKDGCGIRASDQSHLDETTDIVDNNINFPGGVYMTEEPKIISQEDYDKVVAKNADLVKEIDSLRADETLKAKDIEISAKDAKISELTAEINRRDNEITASLVEEITAMDAEFAMEEGMALSTVQTIHASLTRALKKDVPEVKAAEQEKIDGEFVKAGNFTAPAGNVKKSGMTVGGMRNGVWSTD